MREAMAQFEEQREVLIYLADLGLAICSVALLVNFLRAIVDLVT